MPITLFRARSPAQPGTILFSLSNRDREIQRPYRTRPGEKAPEPIGRHLIAPLLDDGIPPNQ